MICVAVKFVHLNMKMNYNLKNKAKRVMHGLELQYWQKIHNHEIEWNPASYLKSLHTKQLMHLLNHIRACNGHRYEVNNNPNYGKSWVTIEEVKAELATREHVLNKPESKLVRQNLAKMKKNR